MSSLAEIEIRPPKPSEMPYIMDLRWRGLYKPLGLTVKMLDEQSNPMDNNPKTLHVAAFAGHLPVSTVRIEPHPEHGDYVSLMATDEEWRGKGVGAAVLSAAERRASDDMGIDFLKLHAAPDAIGFYEKNGYSKNGHDRTGHTKYGEIVYVGMQKELR